MYARTMGSVSMNTVHLVAALEAMRVEGIALREALMDQDIEEVRFRALRLQAVAEHAAVGPILLAANSLVERLEAGVRGAAPDYADALVALSDAIERATRSLS